MTYNVRIALLYDRLPIIPTLLTCLIFFLYGCAALDVTPEIPPHLKTKGVSLEIDTLVDELSRQNHDLKSYKGIGRFKQWGSAGNRSGRVVWAGVVPDRFRIQILDPTGRPAISIALQSGRVSLLSHSDNRFKQYPATRATMEKILSAPVSVKELVAILGGRIPIAAHHYRWLSEASETGGGNRRLVLYDEKGRDVERITLNARRVSAIERLDPDDGFGYQVQRGATLYMDGFELPSMFSFINGKNEGISLHLERVWPNAVVNDKLFVLSPAK